MKRVFLPVGQGAFYCEKFSNEDFCCKVNVVYDCGSISGLAVLKSVIERAFDTGEEIDAAFISHLHEDHINGLPFLMERCRIKRVYLPMIEDSDLALMRLAYGIQRHSKPAPFDNLQDEYKMAVNFVREVLLNPSEAIMKHANGYAKEYGLTIFPIPVANDDAVQARAVETSREIFGNKVDNALLRKWIYAPFNVRNERDAATIRSRFVEVFGDDMSPSRIAKLIDEATNRKETLLRIRALYDGIKGGFNANSMVLYSGAVDTSSNQRPNVWENDHEQITCKIPDFTTSGCLYLGDFIAKTKYWKKLKMAYRKHWHDIGCVQIPHHGAEQSFNDEFLEMNAYNVISAGLGNKYHHPSTIVLQKYASKGVLPYIVTQIPTSVFSTVVKIV